MNSLPCLRRSPPNGFPMGSTAITGARDPSDTADRGLGMDFSVLRQQSGEMLVETTELETAWVLLRGSAEIGFGGTGVQVNRASCFDEPPTALHAAAGTAVSLRAVSPDVEWAIVRTTNERRFEARLFLPADLVPEYRGAGLVQNACLRNVRLIFDRTTRPESNLVVGEVVNYAGRWSSYPPHHHDQPEIYHYRFSAPDGYGHAEIGDEVFKVREADTIVIPPGRDHAQVSAPGYGMYYLWMIRHLPGNPYTGFTFAPEHTWTLDASRQGWRAADLPAALRNA
jgi:5-deoxy-glucuronate isomerase